MDSRLALALKYHDAGLYHDAWDVLSDLVAAPEASMQALHVALSLRLATGVFEDVIAFADRILVQDADNPDAWLAKGQALVELGNLEAARVALETAAALNPCNAAPEFALGLLHHRCGRLTEAERAYRAALALQPVFPAAWSNLGNVLDDLGRSTDAKAAFAMAIGQAPDFSPAHNNLGASLAAEGRVHAAAVAHDCALAHDPDNLSARVNWGVALLEQGRVDDALTAFDAVLARDAANTAAADNRLYTQLYTSTDPVAVAAAHTQWGARWSAPVRIIHDPTPHRILRVGYVSPDFRRHSMSFFTEALLRAHDKAVVEVFCYADVVRADAVTARLQRLVPHWRNICGRDDEAVFRLIQENRIDILVDLAGHTTGNRLGVFARRAAPIQVTALGYPATTGLPAMDYRFCDAVTDPPASDAFATERPVRLPLLHCYTPPQDAPPVQSLPAATAGHLTFGSFNKLAKISTLTVDLWAGVLTAVPTARLLIKAKPLVEEETRTALAARFAARGINPARLEMMGWSPGDSAHLDLYGRVDVALDTFPYNGTTTTCEALWMGVPVLTLAGRGHAGRVGASLLTAVGLQDWVAADPDAYTAKAAAAALDIFHLSALRNGLRERVRQSRLCDATAYTRSVEDAYRTFWRDALTLNN